MRSIFSSSVTLTFLLIPISIKRKPLNNDENSFYFMPVAHFFPEIFSLLMYYFALRLLPCILFQQIYQHIKNFKVPLTGLESLKTDVEKHCNNFPTNFIKAALPSYSINSCFC